MTDTIIELVEQFNLKFKPVNKTREEILDNYSWINYDIYYDLAYAFWDELSEEAKECFNKYDWLEATEYELIDGITDFYEVAPDELYFFDKYTYALILKNDSNPNKFLVGISHDLDFTKCSCIVER